MKVKGPWGEHGEVAETALYQLSPLPTAGQNVRAQPGVHLEHIACFLHGDGRAAGRVRMPSLSQHPRATWLQMLSNPGTSADQRAADPLRSC